MSASFASWSPMFYEVKRRLPRKLIGGGGSFDPTGAAALQSIGVVAAPREPA
jgi:hypothetical protein